ncbi:MULTISPECIES: DUF3828 domain-containing protein [unclassified Brevundimonas]|uniref:DUF3828 domain-containing protein n=1 Tax=unclassified Brevundimonas TaxID=2622653 RepID=UPI0006F88531|nr:MULTISPECIES: DUF3828 domain-containing protein [unclassified Brevundimonas]KQY93664.1 hypothetical protein ASD25_17300 [Brevundimonas sp. Root1423]KRA28955.1 hypothetical protein ASD59_03890 [Brevundimonas sp. Root608]
MRHVLIAAVLTGLAACSPEGAPSEPADAPAALPPGRPAIYEAAKVGPEAFVRALYAVYAAPGQGPGEPPPPPGRDPIYDRMLNAMIGEDFRKANGEVPTLNYDPICGCQDSGDFTLDSVTVTETGPQAAEAAVVFTNMGETKRPTLKLVKEGAMWKVSDVLVPGEKPLTEQLMAAIS